MNKSVKDIMRQVGNDELKDQEQERFRQKADEVSAYYDNVGDKSELEKRHDRFRQRQEYTSRLGPAAERLPILTKEERERREKKRPVRRAIQFEGPIEKLIEKYNDPKEVFNHMSLGQLMKYALEEETGCIYEKDKMIFDGEKLVSDDEVRR
jgi:hypothetical protein